MNSSLTKKIILILLLLIVTAVIGFLIYSLFFKPDIDIDITTPTATSTVGVLPVPGIREDEEIEITDSDIVLPTPEDGGVDIDEVATGGLTKTTAITDDAAINPTLSKDGDKIQYYNEKDGKFYRIDENGELVTLSDKVFHDVDDITWSPKKNKAILEYPDGANIIYDFDTGKQITLPRHWEDFNFSPTGENIVMESIGIDPENRWLAITGDDGSRTRPIEHIGNNANRVYPSWSPNNKTIAMYTQDLDFDRQEVFFLGLNNENFKSTIVQGRGFQHKWSDEGNRLVYSVYSSDNDFKPKLWVVNAEDDSIGSGRKNLDINTWAEKCTFTNNEELYCAVPENLEEGAGLVPEIAQNSKDNLYKIDINTGAKRLIAVPEGSYNISNLMVTENEDKLYFTDARTKILHKIDLK